ncbi:unnamed protein product [Didymodactylos carnosus]|uniref:Uncharacterized protein n=1 Tax=Didymodactylos carnosus TaxID=1234261 RepID=A0A815W834_9BILA|nr:unnamed protein product [Didymodactylos carnosus]CAF4398799.1 unnamed protein product [Didymodactylos carnosus]
MLPIPAHSISLSKKENGKNCKKWYGVVWNGTEWAIPSHSAFSPLGLSQPDIKYCYYRGLTLSDREIEYYMDKIDDYFYTTSFCSFTTDRMLTFRGNAIMILYPNDNSKNIANIWKWSEIPDEKEAVVSIGSKIKIISVHYYGSKWEIEIQLMNDEKDDRIKHDLETLYPVETNQFENEGK